MRKQLFLLLTVLIVGSCALAAPKNTPAKKLLPVWQPAPALLKQLAPQSELPFGTIRLPKGYELFDFPFDFEIGTSLSWAKKSSNGEPIHLFLIVQVPLEELGWQRLPIEESLRGYMEGFNTGFENAQRTPVKQGLVNGKRTLRTEWSGIHRKSRVRLQGSLFIMKDATDAYIIQTAHKNNSVGEQRLASSAALTFKIQNQG